MKAAKFSIKKGQEFGVIVRNEKGASVERQTATVKNISADGIELILSNGARIELFFEQGEQ